MVLALLVALVLVPLLWIPGMLLVRAWYGAGRPADPLHRTYEAFVAGALLNGWLALALAGLAIFTAWLHLLLLSVGCGVLALRAARRGGLDGWRPTPIPAAQRTELAAFAVVGAICLALVAQPFEVVVGARDAGVYANTGFAMARTGALVQIDPIVAGIGGDQQSPDAALRAAAAQAETNFLGVQHPERFIASASVDPNRGM
ncbi:MAG TPA: hypothetical protein PKA05_15150, partial [Roseiflexaceae bacterium]|nr:hypothetical protein [Roseiflexaceae bacterium]